MVVCSDAANLGIGLVVCLVAGVTLADFPNPNALWVVLSVLASVPIVAVGAAIADFLRLLKVLLLMIVGKRLGLGEEVFFGDLFVPFAIRWAVFILIPVVIPVIPNASNSPFPIPPKVWEDGLFDMLFTTFFEDGLFDALGFIASSYLGGLFNMLFLPCWVGPFGPLDNCVLFGMLEFIFGVSIGGDSSGERGLFIPCANLVLFTNNSYEGGGVPDILIPVVIPVIPKVWEDGLFDMLFTTFFEDGLFDALGFIASSYLGGLFNMLFLPCWVGPFGPLDNCVLFGMLEFIFGVSIGGDSSGERGLFIPCANLVLFTNNSYEGGGVPDGGPDGVLDDVLDGVLDDVPDDVSDLFLNNWFTSFLGGLFDMLFTSFFEDGLFDALGFIAFSYLGGLFDMLRRFEYSGVPLLNVFDNLIFL